MDRDEKLIRLKGEFGKQQVNALDQLLLRQQAEYTAKGLNPGDDRSLDKKIASQQEALIKKINDREAELLSLADKGKVDEFEKKLDDPDPYGLKHDGDGKKLPDEPNAQSDYWKGLKWGQTLQYHDEKIADRIIEMAPNDDVGKGLRDGQELRKQDIGKDKEQSISPEIWDEMKMDITQPTKGFDKGKSQDKEKG